MIRSLFTPFQAPVGSGHRKFWNMLCIFFLIYGIKDVLQLTVGKVQSDSHFKVTVAQFKAGYKWYGQSDFVEQSKQMLERSR